MRWHCIFIQFHPSKSEELLEIDEIDRKILGELTADCRVSYRQLAKKTKVSIGTALNRIKRMEKIGVIKGYSAIVDQEKIGYQ